MRFITVSIVSIMMSWPALAGDWGGSLAVRSVYNDFHIYYDERSSSAGLQATFDELALTGTYSFNKNSIAVQVASSSDPDFDNFWGGSGAWDANGNPCTPASCPFTAERSDFNLTYTRQLSNGLSAFTGFYSGSVSWEETAGRKFREAAGNNVQISNICEANGQSVETKVEFENENFGVFVGGAYTRRLTDRLFGTVKLALILDGEADVSEKFSCAGGVTPLIGDTGSLFEGTASSFGLSGYYVINDWSGLNFAYDTKEFSYDNGIDYWSGGTARTEESVDITSLSYVINF